MKRLYVLCAAGAIAAAGCTSSSTPAQPSSSAAPVDASLTASVTAPRPVSPAAGAVFRNTDQPVTLVVANAAITQGSASYTFEVATDAGFASKVYSKGGVAQTATQTALTIDRLTAGADYYWRARADAGGTTGPFSAARKFTIGPAVQIDPPTPVSPTNGATTQGWPGLTVKNSTRSGPVGAIAYRFELSTSATFSNIVLSGTVAEANTNTTFVPPSSTPAPSSNTVFWRVTAIDQSNNVSSPVSSTSSFVYSSPTQQAILAAQQGLALWPGPQPTGTNGLAHMGPGWQLQTLTSFNGVPFTSPPIEALRLFDLLDRGYDPNAAIAWMQQNGYPTQAVWYASVAAIGLPYQYMALIGGSWELVYRVGA